MIPPHLHPHLDPLARRQHATVRWMLLTVCWFAAALVAVILLAGNLYAGAGIRNAWILVALLGVVPAWALRRAAREFHANYEMLADTIESRFPELDGRLLTALDQRPSETGYLGYLQIRVIRECLDHNREASWASRLPYMWERTARLLHAAAFATFILATAGLAIRSGGVAAPSLASDADVTVTPGDVQLERGETLVVMARFGGREPGQADLVLSRPGEPDQRIPLVKSLSDPLFGVSVPGVDRDLAYRVEYDDARTRPFAVEVFEYPRLERADAEIHYPEYTAQPAKRIDDTRRVSAVQGSRLDLSLRLNKPAARATLRAVGGDGLAVPLDPAPDAPTAALTGLVLDKSHTFRLELVDDEGRTNRTPAQFVVRVYPNRPPELKIVSPAGDTRPSPLEEVTFEGSVWDDFGVQAYGLAYSRAGERPEFLELGTSVAARETQAFRHLLALEDLGVDAEDLVSWFLWAEDIGPDGEARRTMSSLYFAEVRPFDEVFREGQSQAGNQGGGRGGEDAGELTERLKELINATWRLQREADAPPPQQTRTNGRGNVEQDTLDGKPPPMAERVSGGPVRPSGMASHRSPPPAVFGLPAAAVFAQAAPAGPDAVHPDSDIEVLRAAQTQVLELARQARDNQREPGVVEQWDKVIDLMETALNKLADASTPAAFEEANAAQQAAFQALLRLQEREFSVSQQNQGQNQGGDSARQRQMQNQLDQLELTQSENRYETESQAAPPQSEEQREELQIMSRLRELAQRQEDLNQRFQELQTALQEAQTPEEREALQRELKRLQDEQREMLDSVDELQQRMDRPENQSRMSRQRDQLEQTREDMQRAAEAAEAGEPSQALAAGTRAQRSMREMREDMRQQNAGEFTEEMRDLRREARELADRQEPIRDQLAETEDTGRRELSQDPDDPELQRQLDEQAERLDKLVDRITDLSRESDEAEPLMSRELYDSLREYTQDDQDAAQQTERDLIDRGLMTRDLYDRLQEVRGESDARMVEVTSELAREGYRQEAREAEARARAGIGVLRDGIERAAERVLGSEAEALRMARDQLGELTNQLEQEVQQAEAGDQQAEAGEQQAEAGNAQGETGAGTPTQSLEDLVRQGEPGDSGPLTGGGFGGWSDGLREVEELVDDPAMRGDLARARERARMFRQAFRREDQRPDWVDVRLEVMTPLIEVRGELTEELARREPRQDLVPIDRDAVPSRYQDLVRRYYESLGGDE